MQALNLISHSPDDVVARLSQRREAIPKTADVVIVGGGIMGLASAYYLSKRGLAVVVVEKDKIASQQSGRNWGFVRKLYRDSAELPLALKALQQWGSLEQELGYGFGWKRNGCLFLAQSEEEQSVFEQWCEETRDIVTDATMLGTAEVANLFPMLDDKAAPGLYTPTDGQAEPVLATYAFARASEANKVQILEGCGAIEIEVSNGAVSGLLTEHGYIRTPSVVCAAGAYSQRLLRKTQLGIPQQVVRSTVSLTTPVEIFDSPCFCGYGLGMRQRADGSCIIAADSDVDIDISLDTLRGARFFLPSFLAHKSTFSLRFGKPFFDELEWRLKTRADEKMFKPRRPEIPPNTKRAERMLALFRDLFNVENQVVIAKSWAGHIDVMPDALPVLDAPSQVSGLVVATGFSGHGFGLGPAVGSVVADFVSGKDPDIETKPFRLDRFRLGTYRPPHAPL